MAIGPTNKYSSCQSHCIDGCIFNGYKSTNEMTQMYVLKLPRGSLSKVYLNLPAAKVRLSYHLCVKCFSQLSFDSEVYTKSATAADFVYTSEFLWISLYLKINTFQWLLTLMELHVSQLHFHLDLTLPPEIIGFMPFNTIGKLIIALSNWKIS